MTETLDNSNRIDLESADVVKKKYESMTYDEMSQHMAESFRQMSEMLGNRSIASSLSSEEETASEMIESDDDNKKWTNEFIRTASNGDAEKLKEMLSDDTIRPFIDINARDSDGTPPLIYASCFGKTEIAQVLVEAGAHIDAQDGYGWSALMWATNNNHESLVKLLLDHGASSQTRSAKGRTVFDFINTDNHKIVDILATNPRDSFSSTSSFLYKTTGSVSSSSSSTGDTDFYYQTNMDGFDSFMAEEAEMRKKLFESTMALVGDADDIDNIDNNDDEDDDDEQDNEFHWEKCSPDQMFVFNSNDLDYILDTVISHIQLPIANQQEICVPANIIFLSARFAHYFSSAELLEEVLTGALTRISTVIKANTRNVHVLAFWMANLTRLLFYLKRDSGLVVVTAEQQLALSELISETYTFIIQDTERRITKILGPAMLEHEEIPGMDQVDFTDDWHRFFRKSARRSVMVPPDGVIAVQATSDISPQSITSLLSSTLFVLQSYDVHPIIIIQTLAQFFHYISCELFNRIMTNKKLLCRSKAMQVRMNLSHLEDWISVNKLPVNLLSYLNPTTQLLQLLQCLTHLQDLMDFINTSKKFDALNASQIKRCVISYRYEVSEPHIPEEIEKYAMQCAEDTVRYVQSRRQSMDKAHISRRHHQHKSSNKKLGDSTTQSKLPPIQDEEEDEDIKETKDAKFMLPFSVPTTAHMMSVQHWDKQEHSAKSMIPFIPEEWMDKLDKEQKQDS